jgi:hypothetical protein
VPDLEQYLEKFSKKREYVESTFDYAPETPRVPKFVQLYEFKAAPIRHLTLSNVGLSNLVPIMPLLTSAFVRSVNLSYNPIKKEGLGIFISQLNQTFI